MDESLFQTLEDFEIDDSEEFKLDEDQTDEDE